MTDALPLPLPAHSGPDSLLQQYRTLCARSRPTVLATVVETFGSTYRKAGARMLIDSDGRSYGLIGGGCFEGDLHDHAQAVFAGAPPRVLFYDMRAPEDALWGLSLGCNGAVRLLLQRLQEDGRDPLMAQIEQVLLEDSARVIATVTDGVLAGHSYGPDTDDAMPAVWRPLLKEQMAVTAMLAQPQWIRHQRDGENLAVFYDYMPPPPRLLLVGAGADATPVVALARQLGWRVVLADHRPAYVVPARFPGAEILQANPAALLPALGRRRIDAAVLMTHNIDYDARFLRELAALPCRYVGLLGPLARRERLLDMAGLEAAAFGDRLRGPVGLDIGGATPESIALSLLAEIHAVLHERDAAPLHLKQQPVQTRERAN